MRSSSKLFPVSLMAAEMAGPFHEDVYELRPGNSSDASVSISVTRVSDPRRPRLGKPVVLVHREFGNRRFWFAPDGQGIAADLAHAGFDVWLPEMRGHGLSPRNQRWTRNTLSDIRAFRLACGKRLCSGAVPGRPPMGRFGDERPESGLWRHRSG